MFEDNWYWGVSVKWWLSTMRSFWWQQLPLLILIQLLEPGRTSHKIYGKSSFTYFPMTSSLYGTLRDHKQLDSSYPKSCSTGEMINIFFKQLFAYFMPKSCWKMDDMLILIWLCLGQQIWDCQSQKRPKMD